MELQDRKHKRMSIEELRSFSGFENYSDEEAKECINTLETLSNIFFQLYIKELKKQEQVQNVQEEIKEKGTEHLTIIKNESYESHQRNAA